MALCEHCGQDHGDPKDRRKTAERSLTVLAVVAAMQARGLTSEDANVRHVLSVRSVELFVSRHLEGIAHMMRDLGMAKLEELEAAGQCPLEWIQSQSENVQVVRTGTETIN